MGSDEESGAEVEEVEEESDAEFWSQAKCPPVRHQWGRRAPRAAETLFGKSQDDHLSHIKSRSRPGPGTP
jgi:hypothetical protein